MNSNETQPLMGIIYLTRSGKRLGKGTLGCLGLCVLYMTSFFILLIRSN